jgi:hypothetical protein
MRPKFLEAYSLYYTPHGKCLAFNCTLHGGDFYAWANNGSSENHREKAATYGVG